MKKAELQALYKHVKQKGKMTPTYGTSLFARGQQRTGCKTCGKVTWRPNRRN